MTSNSPVSRAKEPTTIPEIEMVEVKGGTFVMGLDESEAEHSYETPRHQVTLSDFRIGKYEVTQDLWKAVMGDNPSSSKGDRLPVESVSWNDIQIFIKKLNKMTGRNYRLPTEAEWEFAAKGGNLSKGYAFIGGNEIDKTAWHSHNADKHTHKVGLLNPNELGIYDIRIPRAAYPAGSQAEPLSRPVQRNPGTPTFFRSGSGFPQVPFHISTGTRPRWRKAGSARFRPPGGFRPHTSTFRPRPSTSSDPGNPLC